MGVFKTSDGRTLVGLGQQDGNEYSGFAGWRDCVIQLTASGATENSVKYLNAIKDYAIVHNAKGESIMPPNMNIWISNIGVTTAVQADDIAVDGENVTICGIKWNGTAWDYTDAGKGSGGGVASEPLVLTLVPGSAQNPFTGTFTGATGEEIQSAWSAGRNVIADFPGVGSIAVNMISSNSATTNFTYAQGPTTYFARLTIVFENGSYDVSLFSGLTPAT